MELTEEQFIELRTIIKICLNSKGNMISEYLRMIECLDDDGIKNYMDHFIDSEEYISFRELLNMVNGYINTELILG